MFVISKWALKIFRVPCCNSFLARTVCQIHMIKSALKSCGVRLSNARKYVCQKATQRVENAISSFFSTFFMAKMGNQFWNRTVPVPWGGRVKVKTILSLYCWENDFYVFVCITVRFQNWYPILAIKHVEKNELIAFSKRCVDFW